ncbi:unnamed protein product, partial [Amoebophrya sp. A120]
HQEDGRGDGFLGAVICSASYHSEDADLQKVREELMPPPRFLKSMLAIAPAEGHGRGVSFMKLVVKPSLDKQKQWHAALPTVDQCRLEARLMDVFSNSDNTECAYWYAQLHFDPPSQTFYLQWADAKPFGDVLAEYQAWLEGEGGSDGDEDSGLDTSGSEDEDDEEVLELMFERAQREKDLQDYLQNPAQQAALVPARSGSGGSAASGANSAAQQRLASAAGRPAAARPNRAVGGRAKHRGQEG